MAFMVLQALFRVLNPSDFLKLPASRPLHFEDKEPSLVPTTIISRILLIKLRIPAKIPPLSLRPLKPFFRLLYPHQRPIRPQFIETAFSALLLFRIKLFKSLEPVRTQKTKEKTVKKQKRQETKQPKKHNVRQKKQKAKNRISSPLLFTSLLFSSLSLSLLESIQQFLIYSNCRSKVYIQKKKRKKKDLGLDHATAARAVAVAGNVWVCIA